MSLSDNLIPNETGLFESQKHWVAWIPRLMPDAEFEAKKLELLGRI